MIDGSSGTVVNGAALPTVSVVVPTRNRPAHAVACAETVLACGGFVDLIVVDQSDDRSTEQALSVIADSRLRYVRTETRGVTRGRNLGIESSRSEIVAFTDDDCRPKPDWVERLTAVFATDPSATVVCGRVQVPLEIQHLGWAESFQPRTREWMGRYPPLGQWGISANLSLRRSVVESVGPLDPMLGAGTALLSGGEPDFLFRVLRAGLKVVNADEVIVDHLGLRKPGVESQKLLRGYGVGTAAAFAKHIRVGDPAAAMVYARFLGSLIFQVFGALLRRGRPTGGGFLLAFLTGTFMSYGYAIDRKRRLYVDR